MTNPNRIEELLNGFGETISDLPKPADFSYSYSHDYKQLMAAKRQALIFIMDEWRDCDEQPELRYQIEEVLTDYICHQSDVIEKLVKALEKAYTYWEEQKKYYDRITCAGLDKLQSGEGQK